MNLTAQLNYIAKMDAEPTVYMCSPPEGVSRRNVIPDKRSVSINDARKLKPPPLLDEYGFELVPFDTRIKNFYDTDQVRKEYYPEVESFLGSLTQAKRVFVFDHNVRNFAMFEKGLGNAKEPVFSVHNDYTESSAPQRVRDLHGAQATRLLSSRFAFINVWKPIRGPVEKTPLAVCDARTILKEDFSVINLIYEDRVGHVQGVKHREAHAWYYYPKMETNEALVFKCFDSDSAYASPSAHTAFKDPTSSEEALPRESIEVRAMVFFGS